MLSHEIKFCRRKAEVNMEGQFLVRQIYDDEITYNLIGAAVEVLSEFHVRNPLQRKSLETLDSARRDG